MLKGCIPNSVCIQNDDMDPHPLRDGRSLFLGESLGGERSHLADGLFEAQHTPLSNVFVDDSGERAEVSWVLITGEIDAFGASHIEDL